MPRVAHLVQATGRAVRARGGQGGERAAVAVGAEGDTVLGGQQDLARGPVHGRHLALDEEPDVLQPEAVVGLEEGDRGLVVLGAGHDVERQRPAMPAPQRDDLLGVDLEQAGRGDRADRKGPLGTLEAQPGARTAGDQDHADLAGGQRLGPDLGGPAPGHALAVGLRQPDHLDRLDPVGLDRRRGIAVHQLVDQAVELLEIDRRDLGLAAGPAGLGQVAPPREAGVLSMTFQTFDQFRVGRHRVRLTPHGA